MTTLRTLAALALVALFVVPTVASATIVQKWQTAAGASYHLRSRAGDLDGDGVYDLITGEISGADEKIGIRSGATGALLAQTALAYKINAFYLVDLDGDGLPEFIIQDGNTGHFLCFNLTIASGTLAVRWTSTVAFVGQTVDLTCVDFDGNARLYTVLMVSGASQFVVYDRNGALVSQVTIPGAPTGPPPGWSSHIGPTVFDGQQRQQLLVDYRANGGSADEVWVYQSSSAVGVDPGVTGANAVALGPSCPNPMFSLTHIAYSMPTAGTASLRLYDVAGREIRSLLNGPVPAGQHEATWDGRDGDGRQVPAGAYFYDLSAGGEHRTQRVVRLR